MSIELIGIRKRFGSNLVLDDVALRIDDGELVALLGPSGSGKTTLLRIVAGLEQPDVGDLAFDGESALRRGARERQIGFVFQHYALFRHMTVLENVAFGLRVRPRERRPAAAEIERRVRDLLELVHIGGLSARYPHQLSGGQRQRVALARALAIEPRVLLLDEPFGALDAQVRKDLRRWLRSLHDRLGMTTVFVTHDQEEALELADRVVVMGKGRIEQVGSPDEVYRAPASDFVFGFLGQATQIACEVIAGRPTVPGITLAPSIPALLGASRARLFVRPHDVELTPAAEGEGVVRFVSAAGPLVRVEVQTPALAAPLEAQLAHDAFERRPLAPGERVRVTLRKATIFPEPPAAQTSPPLAPLPQQAAQARAS